MTRKMMGVIYRAFKEGNLQNTTKDDISNMYYWIEKFGDEMFGDYEKKMHHDEWLCVKSLKNAVDAIFDKDYRKAELYTKGFASV